PALTTVVWGVSGDGSVVVGSATSPNPNLRAHAFIWDAQHGARDLNDLLTSEYSLDLGEGVLVQAFCISADGSRLAGNAYHADVHDHTTISWLVRLHPGCHADFNSDGVVSSQDFFAFITAFFASAPDADFNSDGSIDSRDFFDFLP